MQQQIEHRQQKRDEQIAPLLGRSERQRANAPTGKWRSLPTRTAGDFSVGGGVLLAEKQRQTYQSRINQLKILYPVQKM